MKPTWTRLSAERPPISREGLLMSEPAHARIVYVSRDEVWAMADSRTWSRLDITMPPGDDMDRQVVAWTTTTGHALIGRFTDEALYVMALSAPGVQERYARPQPAPSIAEAFAFMHDGEVFIHISDDEGETFKLDGKGLTKIADGPYLLADAYHPGHGRAYGYDVSRNLHAFDGRAWTSLFRFRAEPQGLAWHPGLEAIVTFHSEGEDGMRLHRVMADGSEPLTPAVLAPAYRHGGELAVRTDGTVVFSGGQDFARSGSPTDETFASAPGQSTMLSDMQDDPPAMGRYDTLVTTADHLVRANHSNLQITTPVDHDWPAFARAPESKSGAIGDDRFLNFTAWDRWVWMLDGDGALWEAQRGEALRRVGAPEPGPGGRYSNRIALGYDTSTDRVMAFGGVDRNDTWAFDRKAQRWQQLRPQTTPPHGIASMVTTPQGLYALTERQLWRFWEQDWTCVARDVPGATLLFDPARDRLLLAGWGEDDDPQQAVWAWSDEGARMLTRLPDDVRLVEAYQSGAYLGLDPRQDRLLLMGEDTGAYALELTPLDLTKGTLPTTAIEPPTRRHATPPPEWTRAAATLSRTDRTLPRIPRLGVAVEGQLIAVLPATPQILSLPPGYGAIAISGIEDWYSHGDRYEPWRLDGGGYYATLVPEGVEVPAFIVEDGVAVVLELRPFTEVDPVHQHQVDTLPGDASLVYGSKLGGYPRFVQDDPAESWTGPALRFAVQLSGDLYEVGDWGKTYVWISDDPPRGYVVTQSH